MNKFRQLIATIVSTLTIAAAPLAAHAGPDFKWWATGQTSGQINLINASGVQRQNLPSNPTGAQAVRSANTQAPTVIVQATQSLPVKNIGDTCTQTTSGTAPNQSAAEGTAITADRIMLLTCNAATGVWLPARVYANEGDACNVIYKTTSYVIGDRLVLAAALPSGTIASNSAGLTLSCQSGVWAAFHPSGMLCGFSGPNLQTNCKGVAIGYGPGSGTCPPGFTRTYLDAFYDGAMGLRYYYSCIKN